ncbi:Heavy metal RND efflux outer membrane protein, CzcC family [Oxalobacteraceae bacterium IMCC9480]|nr:Heavy metal RND efflux outer membrane protein, CzcC family [Oxalobacteraceae bacterium IMCC9480]NDP58265.1 TolC family protein [Oxalobacteraceae bacterium]
MYPRATLVSTLLLTLLLIHASASFAGNANLTLDDALQSAHRQNHDLRLAGIAIASAHATSVMAAAAPNPMLTLQTVGINPHTGIGAGGLRDKTVDSAVRVDQLIERGDKRALRTQNAMQLEVAAQHDLDDVQRQLGIAVSQAYYDVLAALEKQTLTRQSAALYDTTVAAAQKRLKAGDLASADVARLQIDALRAQNDVVQSGADLARAREVLALLLGTRDAPASLTPTDPWPTLAFDASLSPQSLDALLARRADVLAAQARVDAAVTARKQALALRTRDVSVGVQFDHYPVSATNTQGSGNTIGIALQIPLFVRYQYDGEIRLADSLRDSAEQSLARIRDLARSDLARSRADAQAAFERIARYDDGLLAAARKSVDATEFAFAHGALGVMDVLDARRTWRATQLDALAARADYAKSLAAWQAATNEKITP